MYNIGCASSGGCRARTAGDRTGGQLKSEQGQLESEQPEGGRPVAEADLDLSLAALFAGYALNDEVQRRLHAAGFEGLRFSHGFLVQHLVEGGKPVGGLAELMGVTQQAVSKTVRELEELGYVERHAAAADARVRVVTLTARGRAALEAARAARADLTAELREALGPRRVEAATAVLREVLRSTGALTAVRGRRVRPPG